MLCFFKSRVGCWHYKSRMSWLEHLDVKTLINPILIGCLFFIFFICFTSISHERFAWMVLKHLVFLMCFDIDIHHIFLFTFWDHPWPWILLRIASAFSSSSFSSSSVTVRASASLLSAEAQVEPSRVTSDWSSHKLSEVWGSDGRQWQFASEGCCLALGRAFHFLFITETNTIAYHYIE